MTASELFASYAYPPNELGYCGPADTSIDQLASHVTQFDGAWPYLQTLADAAGIADPLDAEVVRNYWVGGPLLEAVDTAVLLARLRESFAGQVTGLLGDLPESTDASAHHSFHVFVVYPWIRFLDRDPTTPIRVMQDCRIRWGTVENVDDDQAVVISQPLAMCDGLLRLGAPAAEKIVWRKNGTSLCPRPTVGATVAAHWDWICGSLDEDDRDALAAATQATLDLVNRVRLS